MAISSVSMGMNGTQWGAYKQKLSQATKDEMERLGIPYNDSTSESQAKTLIQQAKLQDNKNNNTTNNNTANNNSSSKNPLFEQAKKLAQKLGLAVDEKANFEELLTQIETTLEEKIQANSDNMDMLTELKGYSRQLAMIQSQTTGSYGSDSTNQALMMSLEMLSQYNKSFLNN